MSHRSGAMRRTAAFIEKETKEILRDPITLGIALIMPLLLLFLFGYAINFDIENVPFGVLDFDRSAESRALIDRFQQSGFFSLIRVFASQTDLANALMVNDIRLAVVIPPDFAKTLRALEPAPVQVIVDGTFAASAGLVMKYAQMIVGTYGAAGEHLLGLEARIWYNPDLRSAHYVIPGLFGVILMAIPPLLTALAVTREKESGSIQQIFASPLRSSEFITGKLVPYAVIAAIQMLMILSVGFLWFEVPVEGSLALLVVASLVYVLCTVSLGLLVSTVTQSQLIAMLVALIVTLMPSFLFSGFIFPLFTMPEMMQYYARAFPAAYFVDVSRGIVMKGAGVSDAALPLAFLVAYSVVVFTIAVMRLRKKVA